jgi:3-hydroxyacyl-CoA dehydrogenase
VAASAKGFIAPLSIAKATRAAVELPFKQGMVREAQLFAELAKGTQAPALQYQFFSERSVSNPPVVSDESKVPSVKTVGVIGGGTMGAGISMCFANAGIPVTLVETSQDIAQASLQRIENTYKASSAFKSGKMTEEAVNKLTGLITPSGDMNVLSTADIVIEAVYENMEVKREIFQKLEKICKADAILATNTSYLSVDEVAGVTNRKGSVIGTRKSSHCVMNEYEWLECDLYAQFE